jgi:hypothetical protein
MQTLNTWFHRAVPALLALWLARAAAAPMDEGQALHLLNRLGYGAVPGEVAQVQAMGVQAFVDSRLAPPPDPPRLSELVSPDTPAVDAALLLAIASPRQLEAVLAAFWQDWFSAGQGGRMALRPWVLGSYAALVMQARDRGWTVPKGGEAAALRALVGHFVSAPSPGLLRSLRRVWDKTGGDQRAVLRTLFTSREFLAPAQWHSKSKDDFRFVVSALRASGLAVENAAPLVEFTRRPTARADFVERLAGGSLALARAPVRAHEYASSAPPMRAGESQGTVAQPGPVLMAAPTPSAGAMAAAARSQPAQPERLRALLLSEDFSRY